MNRILAYPVKDVESPRLPFKDPFATQIERRQRFRPASRLAPWQQATDALASALPFHRDARRFRYASCG